jgi:hypothetical protein
VAGETGAGVSLLTIFGKKTQHISRKVCYSCSGRDTINLIDYLSLTQLCVYASSNHMKVKDSRPLLCNKPSFLFMLRVSVFLGY